ncbi:MAG: hypothetical protein WD200_04220 [Candidatus Andersenbacteria bacterium]
MRIQEDSQGGLLFFGGILLLLAFYWLFSLENKSIGSGALILTIILFAWIGWNDQQKKTKFAKDIKFEESSRKLVEESLLATKVTVDGKQTDLDGLFRMAKEYGFQEDVMNLRGKEGISVSKGMINTFHGAVDTLRKKGHTVKTSIN